MESEKTTHPQFATYVLDHLTQYRSGMRESVKGTLESLRAVALSAADHDALHSGERAFQRLDEELGFLVWLCEIESNQLELSEELMELRSVLGKVGGIVEFKSQQRDVGFLMNVVDAVPDNIKGDANRLQFVLVELAGLLLPRVPSGAQLSLSVRPQDVSSGSLLLEFAYELAIPSEDRAEDLERLQERFSTREATLREKVVERLAWYMGPRENQATSITSARHRISFPIRFLPARPGAIPSVETEVVPTLESTQPEALVEVVEPEPVIEEPEEQATILLVEDSPIVQRIARRILTEAGYRVDFANTGSEALSLFKRGDYQAILLDLRLSGISGVDTALAIRELERTRGGRIPIFGLTAHPDRSDTRTAMQAGMDGILPKPLHSGRVTKMLDDYLKK